MARGPAPLASPAGPSTDGAGDALVGGRRGRQRALQFYIARVASWNEKGPIYFELENGALQRARTWEVAEHRPKGKRSNEAKNNLSWATKAATATETARRGARGHGGARLSAEKDLAWRGYLAAARSRRSGQLFFLRRRGPEVIFAPVHLAVGVGPAGQTVYILNSTASFGVAKGLLFITVADWNMGSP
ncbi:unnamed protein product, partial [Prorocentrum cordatum]